jgi:hypothetical protein
MQDDSITSSIDAYSATSAQRLPSRSRSSSTASENQLTVYHRQSQAVDRNQINYLKLRAQMINTLLENLGDFISHPNEATLANDLAAAKNLKKHIENNPEVNSSTILDKVNRAINDTAIKTKQSTGMMSSVEITVQSSLGRLLQSVIEDYGYSKFEEARQKDWDELNASLLADRPNGLSSNFDSKQLMQLLQSSDILNAKIREMEAQIAKEQASLLAKKHELELAHALSTSKERDVQRLTTECSELKSQLKSEQSQAKDKIATLEDDIKDRNGKIDILNKKLLNLQEEHSGTKEEVARLAGAVKALEKDKADLKERAESYSVLHPKFVELETRHKFTEEQNQQLKAEKEMREVEFKAEKLKLEADKEKLEATIKARDATIAAKERTIEKKEQTIAAKDQMIATTINETRDYLSESRAFMETSGWQNSSHLPGIDDKPLIAAKANAPQRAAPKSDPREQQPAAVTQAVLPQHREMPKPDAARDLKPATNGQTGAPQFREPQPVVAAGVPAAPRRKLTNGGGQPTLFPAPKVTTELAALVETQIKQSSDALIRYGLSVSRVKAIQFLARHLNKLGNEPSEGANKAEHGIAVYLIEQLVSEMQTKPTKLIISNAKNGSLSATLKGCSGDFQELIDTLFVLPADEKVTFSSAEIEGTNIGKINNALHKMFKEDFMNVKVLCEFFPALIQETATTQADTSFAGNRTLGGGAPGNN